jgi:hypothetical protein
MTDIVQRDELEQSVPLIALFTAFLAVSFYGVGGASGIVWARRVAVEKRRWISDREFADIVSLCRFMPAEHCWYCRLRRGEDARHDRNDRSSFRLSCHSMGNRSLGRPALP